MIKQMLMVVVVALAVVSLSGVAEARGRSSCPGGVCPNSAAPAVAATETTAAPVVAEAAAQPTRKLVTNVRSMRLRRNG